MKIRNITTDDLGWNGVVIPAGGTEWVSEAFGTRMVKAHPQKFAVDAPAHRMMETKQPVHRHHYRKNGTCACGARKARRK